MVLNKNTRCVPDLKLYRFSIYTHGESRMRDTTTQHKEHKFGNKTLTKLYSSNLEVYPNGGDV